VTTAGAPVFHWFPPTGGDDRTVGAAAHGVRIGGRDPAAPPTGGRAPSYDYLAQLARAADSLGYRSVLTPTGARCEDTWAVTSPLIAQTARLRFLVALRPGLTSPVLAAPLFNLGGRP
jgi:alkanesulfonate monooxygenase